MRKGNKKASARRTRAGLKKALGRHDWAMCYVYEPDVWRVDREELHALRKFRHIKPEKGELLALYTGNWIRKQMGRMSFARRVFGMMIPADDCFTPLVPQPILKTDLFAEGGPKRSAIRGVPVASSIADELHTKSMREQLGGGWKGDK